MAFKAAKYDIKIEQGTTFVLPLKFSDSDGVGIDQTGNTFTGQIRERYNSTTILATFVCTLKNQITNAGEVDCVISAADSASIPALAPDDASDCSKKPPARRLSYFEYDIERTNADLTKDRILEGIVAMSPEVTK